MARVAVLWLTPESYHRAVALSDDEMPESYEAWREKIARITSNLPADFEIVRIEADPDEVAAWCRAQGRPVTDENRFAFAADYLFRTMQH